MALESHLFGRWAMNEKNSDYSRKRMHAKLLRHYYTSTMYTMCRQGITAAGDLHSDMGVDWFVLV